MVAAFLFIAVLLLIGVALRQGFPIFQWLYIPASVIAGAIGLAVIQTSGGHWIPATDDWSQTLRGWPGWLIAVVFAGMLLERKPAPVRESLSRVGRQGLMVWVIVLGQTAIGLLATWWLVQPFYDVPNSFGMLIETGFAGGHGTAAAMGQVYSHPSVGMADGLDLGFLMATCGLVYGVISGILWINIGVRAGWVQPRTTVASTTDSTSSETAETPIGYAKVSSETIDPLLLQLIWLSLAMGIGMAIQQSVSELVGFFEAWMDGDNGSSAAAEPLSDRMTLRSVVESFPLFIYTLFGGLVVRRTLRAFGFEQAIDRETINRLTATAMDILVVSAIATLNLTAVAALIIPFSVLFVCGIIWCAVCLLWISRWLLPRQHWFELGLINYGMSTGTTATGFVLLRMVDPELESGAAEDYALAAPLSSPFVGGGMITIGLPLLVLERFPIAPVALGMTAIVAVMIWAGRRWNAAADRPHDLS